MSENPLKDCPFCGRCAVIVKLGIAHDTYRAMCVNCSVRTLAVKDEIHCRELWNKRVSDENH